MATGAYTNEDDVLRDALRALRDEEDDLEAVRAAVTELQAGDPGTPLDEAFDIVRRACAGTEVE
jgi:putative addiction module CopG family antidote